MQSAGLLCYTFSPAILRLITKIATTKVKSKIIRTGQLPCQHAMPYSELTLRRFAESLCNWHIMEHFLSFVWTTTFPIITTDLMLRFVAILQICTHVCAVGFPHEIEELGILSTTQQRFLLLVSLGIPLSIVFQTNCRRKSTEHAVSILQNLCRFCKPLYYTGDIRSLVPISGHAQTFTFKISAKSVSMPRIL